MKLIHYSSVPITIPNADFYNQKEYERRLWHKPIGLWVSVGEAWKQWCESENYNVECLMFKHLVVLKKNAHILLIDTDEKILTLHKKYPYSSKFCDDFKIDWPKIQREFQGVIISPYSWFCRLHEECNWYYGWDCASGCIWDLECIESFSLIEEEVAV